MTWAVTAAALVVAAAGCAGAPAGSTGTTPMPTVRTHRAGPDRGGIRPARRRGRDPGRGARGQPRR